MAEAAAEASSSDESIISPRDHKDVDLAYLTYAPDTNRDKASQNYDMWFDFLGIKSAALEERTALRSSIRSHLGETHYVFSRKQDNRIAFNQLIGEFFEKHGEEFWGHHKRTHLREMDPSKGFLYPRDVQRPMSRLVELVERLFDWKASLTHNNHRKIPEHKQVIPHISFSAMTGRAVDATKTSPAPKRNLNAIKSAVQDQLTSTFSQDPYVNPKVEKKLAHEKVQSSTGQWQAKYSPLPRARRQTQRDGYVDPSEVTDTDMDYDSPPLKKKAKVSDSIMGPSATSTTGRKQLQTPHSKHQTPIMAVFHAQKPQDEVQDQQIYSKSTKLQHLNSTADLSTEPAIHPSGSRKLKRDRESEEQELTGLLKSFTPRPTASRETSKPTLKTEEDRSLLTAEATDKTVFLVVDSVQKDILQVTVPLSSCGETSEQLFSTLIEARNLSPEAARRVKFISATYTWNGKGQALRRGNADDWTRFCRRINRAWEEDAGGFDEECEIEIVVHVS